MQNSLLMQIIEKQNKKIDENSLLIRQIRTKTVCCTPSFDIRNPSLVIDNNGKNEYTPTSIDIFYTRCNRGENDKYNKLREEIVCDIVNNDIPIIYYEDVTFGSRWNNLTRNLISSIGVISGEYDTISMKIMGGRNYNYDFMLSVTNNNVITGKKIEFKYAKSIFKYPQFLSLYITNPKSKFINNSFIDFWYNNYMDDFIEYANRFSDITVTKPRLINYKKMINDTQKKTNYMRNIKMVVSSLDPHEKLLMNRVVNSAIEHFVRVEYVNLNIEKLRTVFDNQKNKVFLCCWDGKFTTNSISSYLELNNIAISHTSNSIIIKNIDNGSKIKLLLRWKNGKGCAGPAWQIGISE